MTNILHPRRLVIWYHELVRVYINPPHKQTQRPPRHGDLLGVKPSPKATNTPPKLAISREFSSPPTRGLFQCIPGQFLTGSH
jgi:hypothetical protein